MNLFEKSGGDLTVANSKHYARDLRHLVLLNGYALQESVSQPPPLVSIPVIPVVPDSPQRHSPIQQQLQQNQQQQQAQQQQQQQLPQQQQQQVFRPAVPNPAVQSIRPAQPGPMQQQTRPQFGIHVFFLEFSPNSFEYSLIFN